MKALKKRAFVFGCVFLTIVAIPICIVCVALQRRSQCRANLQEIAAALLMWDMDGAGRFPAQLEQLLETPGGYNVVPEVFVCPCAGDTVGNASVVSQWTSYTYVPGHGASDPPNEVVLYCHTKNHGQRGGHVLLVNGQVKWYQTPQFWKVIPERVEKQQRGRRNSIHQ